MLPVLASDRHHVRSIPHTGNPFSNRLPFDLYYIMPVRSSSDSSLQTVVTHPLACLRGEARIADGTVVITGVAFITRKQAGRLSRDRRLDTVAAALTSLLDGTGASPDLILDLSWCTPFQKKILAAARGIPRGATVSYAQLARMAGFPRAVRAAASVMRNNRFPVVVPCHRVIRSDGSAGGFMGKTGGSAIALKRRLLAAESAAKVSPSRCR